MSKSRLCRFIFPRKKLKIYQYHNSTGSGTLIQSTKIMPFFFSNYAKNCETLFSITSDHFRCSLRIKKEPKLTWKKLTAILFIARICLVYWSQFTAVLSTVGWRGIGAGSLKCSYTSTTSHAAFIKRPFGVVTVHSCKRHNRWISFALWFIVSISLSRF